jgi:hypothetical protein
MFPVYLSEAERQKVGQAVNAALLPYVKSEPSRKSIGKEQELQI